MIVVSFSYVLVPSCVGLVRSAQINSIIFSTQFCRMWGLYRLVCSIEGALRGEKGTMVFFTAFSCIWGEHLLWPSLPLIKLHLVPGIRTIRVSLWTPTGCWLWTGHSSHHVIYFIPFNQHHKVNAVITLILPGRKQKHVKSNHLLWESGALSCLSSARRCHWTQTV